MIIDKIALLYLQDGKILSSLSRGKDTWYIPGGKREAGESDEETLVREIKEELCVDILRETIRFYGIFEAQAHGHAENVTVRMTCYRADFTGEPAPANEIQALMWLGYADKLKSSPVDRLIFDDLYNKGLLL